MPQCVVLMHHVVLILRPGHDENLTHVVVTPTHILFV